MLTQEATVTEMFINFHHVRFLETTYLASDYLYICTRLFFILILFKRLYSFHDSLNSTC